MTDDARTVAAEFVVFCDGIEAGGLEVYASRGRRVAALLLEALDELDAERSARRSVQQLYEGALDVIQERGE